MFCSQEDCGQLHDFLPGELMPDDARSGFGAEFVVPCYGGCCVATAPAATQPIRAVCTCQHAERDRTHRLLHEAWSGVLPMQITSALKRSAAAQIALAVSQSSVTSTSVTIPDSSASAGVSERSCASDSKIS